MKPIKGKLTTPTLGTDTNCYIVGFLNATLGVSMKNTSVAIRSVKHSSHVNSDKFRDDAEPSEETRITILLEGKWEQHFWTKEDKSDLVENILESSGDYLIWGRGYWHTWKPLEDSVMLTVSMFEAETT